MRPFGQDVPDGWRGPAGGQFIPVLLVGPSFTKEEVIESVRTGVSQLVLTPIRAKELKRKIEDIRATLGRVS